MLKRDLGVKRECDSGRASRPGNLLTGHEPYFGLVLGYHDFFMFFLRDHVVELEGVSLDDPVLVLIDGMRAL
jgi:hypothetical protein